MEEKENVLENIEEEIKPEKKHKNKKNDEKIKKLEEELGNEKMKSMRIQAEMMNFKKHKEEEFINFKKYANEDILRELVLNIDNFERAMKFENEENKEIFKGFNMVYSNLINILNNNDVKEIDCLNKEFDPNFHQAVLTEAREGIESGIVIEVLQKGYTYKDRVLRPSMVKVSE